MSRCTWILVGLVACGPESSCGGAPPPSGTVPTPTGTPTTPTGDPTTGDTADDCAWPDPDPTPFEGPFGSMEACVGGLSHDEKARGLPDPLTVTVTEQGTGARPDDCVSFVQAGPVLGTDWQWIRGTSGKDDPARVFGWRFAEPTAVPAVDDVLTVQLDVLEKAYVGTQEQELGIVDDGGALVVWAQVGWSADMFRRAPLSLSPAEPVGVGRDECGRWSFRDALVDGVTVPLGQTATVGDLRVVNGDLAEVAETLDPHVCEACEFWLYPVSSMGAYRPAP